MAEGELEMKWLKVTVTGIKWPVIRRNRARLAVIQYTTDLTQKQGIRLAMDTREWLGGELDRIRDAVTAIHPAHIDMTKELADAILDKMPGPLTISTETAEWLRSIGGWVWTVPINHGMFKIQIHNDGSMQLELHDEEYSIAWRGTLQEG
jgi:hypothetical protein